MAVARRFAVGSVVGGQPAQPQVPPGAVAAGAGAGGTDQGPGWHRGTWATQPSCWEGASFAKGFEFLPHVLVLLSTDCVSVKEIRK